MSKKHKDRLTVYIETYGCQMNVNDSEIVSAIINNSGMELSDIPDNADVIFLNTCSVRDNAERKIHERLMHLKQYKKKNNRLVVGVLGCMAERLRSKLLDEEPIVNLAVGPDEYRRLPELIDEVTSEKNGRGIAVKLSRVELYDDIPPLRKEGNSAWLSIMRGCNNFCSYCVVPYTRGRERSRPYSSLVNEAVTLAEEGYKEITLLGQNVNSYFFEDRGFPELLDEIASSIPSVRIRFTTSHPKDFSRNLAEVMAKHDNICKHIHLPLQSGSNRILDIMNRGYSFEQYLSKIDIIREILPGCSLTTDLIAGFPTETWDDHQNTLEALSHIKYDGAYTFRYSPREGTRAFKLDDTVPEEEKIQRLQEIIDRQLSISRDLNTQEVGKVHTVLVEGESKRDQSRMMGRTDTNKVAIFPKTNKTIKSGDVIKMKVTSSTPATLFGEAVE
jgi:tRNA-2-methylthio-N6-dimethylallyladenosine synthase